MKSRHQDQIALPPMQLRNSEQQTPAFRKSEQLAADQDDAGIALASVLFDEALKDSRLLNQDVAYILSQTGSGVSESLVQKWRKPTERACPSFAQLLRLPPQFHIALIRRLDSQFGLGRSLLNNVQNTVATLALLVR